MKQPVEITYRTRASETTSVQAVGKPPPPRERWPGLRGEVLWMFRGLGCIDDGNRAERRGRWR